MSRPCVAAEIDRRDHVGDVGAARDQARPLVDHAVVELARLVVAGVPRLDDSPRKDCALKVTRSWASSMVMSPGLAPLPAPGAWNRDDPRSRCGCRQYDRIAPSLAGRPDLARRAPGYRTLAPGGRASGCSVRRAACGATDRRRLFRHQRPRALDRRDRLPGSSICAQRHARVRAHHLVPHHARRLVLGAARRTNPRSAVRLEAGDAVIFRAGRRSFHDHRARPARRRPTWRCITGPTDRPLPFVFSEFGGNGEPSRFVCGYLGCDARPFNPILDALPRAPARQARQHRAASSLTI